MVSTGISSSSQASKTSTKRDCAQKRLASSAFEACICVPVRSKVRPPARSISVPTSIMKALRVRAVRRRACAATPMSLSFPLSLLYTHAVK